MSAEYALEVIRVENIRWRSRLYSKVPNLYVQMRLGGDVKRTRAIKDRHPTWNEALTFPSVDSSTMLEIDVRNTPPIKGLKSSSIGSITLQLSELLVKCANGETQLSLHSEDTLSRFGGKIHLKMKTLDWTSRAGTDVEETRQIVQRRGTYDRLSGEGELSKSLRALFLKLDVVVKCLDDVSRIHPYLIAVWQPISLLYKCVSSQFRTDQKVAQLVHAMENAFEFACDTQTLRSRTRVLESHIVKLLQNTVECCQFLQKYMQRSFSGRMLSLRASEQVDDFLQSLSDLKNDLDSGLALHNVLIASRTSEEVNTIFLQQRLNVLDCIPTNRQTCLEGTRVEIRQNMIDLLRSDKCPNIVWLKGVAGSGKSTIAATIEDYFRDISQLGAFLLFERGKSEPDLVIRNIAFKLALFDSSIALRITEHVKQDKDIASALLPRQFEKLLLQPLSAAAASASTDVQEPVVIILDALDECGTPHARAELLRLLKDDLPKLPPNIRFLITSRPESDIMKALSSRPDSVYEIELDYTSEASRHDVLSYIRHKMHEIVDSDAELQVPKGWPWDTNMSLLGEAAGGLFIWASTAVKLVSSSDNPFKKLKDLVSNSQSITRFGLNELYATVLRNSGIAWDDGESRLRFRRVLALLLFSKTPLSSRTIDGLLSFPPDEPSHLILSRLRCLLSYTPSEPVRLFHTSFSDYLQSPERSADPWFIDIPAQKAHLTARCFDVMEGMLHFNMCDLETAFVLNSDVLGLETRVKDEVPAHLEYACINWAQHLVDVPYSPCLLDRMASFAYERLLFWFEVLALKKQIGRIAVRALSASQAWAKSYRPEISSFLRDAGKLVSTFSGSISQSTPHIYVSMLPLMKDDSEVAAHYSKRLSSAVLVERMGTKPPPLWLKVLEGHADEVWCIAISPDGQCIASGAQDNTIRVWDLESGELVAGPFEGHRGRVNCVAFSPDGRRIVSGSSDASIRIWEVESGKQVSRPLEGHTGSVLIVAFSSHGTHVVSGSDDNTVRLWDIGSGETVSRTMEGHTSRILCIAFSPDSKRVASGCKDNTIGLWDMENAELSFRPLLGHTDEINSICFSPDGTLVLSGSSDRTIRLWNVENGRENREPLRGHLEDVISVAFSPDGKRIVSGSQDDKVIVWDLASGRIVSGPFTGHTDTVNSAIFSFDGRHIISGSIDKTIRLWDTELGLVVSDSSMAHNHAVQSIALSPSGSCIASGSRDETIRLWNIRTGEAMSDAFVGHKGPVQSISFSPDGTHLVSGSVDKTIIVWDVKSGTVASGPFVGHTGTVRFVAFSPDGRHIASGSVDHSIKIWDAKIGGCRTLEGHAGPVYCVAFSPDGEYLASSSTDMTIRIWNVATGELARGPLTGHTHYVWSVAFSPNGRHLVSGSSDSTIRIWDTQTGDTVYGPFQGHLGTVISVAFSHDGSRLVSGSRDKTIRIWDARTGAIVSEPFEGHTDAVMGVFFSHDDKYIISCSWDKTLRVWDAVCLDSATFFPDNMQLNTKSSVSVASLDVKKKSPQCSSDGATPVGSCEEWTLSEDGWILGINRELLLWVSPDIRPTLWQPKNVALFGCAFSTKLDFRDVAHGERWRQCFNSSRSTL